ncbi:COX15/CtaA family protein [Paenibacillus sp. 1001270B_150601_E10]|uniref:COX15/CtaA family protein n=1 Tax=Paenibacillus sp. 1001270B_150601_E10 TaxID=2787079 RepID=UPI00189FDD0D|nr:heme A synthase [Paenibacillus sp. 1001270B_150601_E10]
MGQVKRVKTNLTIQIKRLAYAVCIGMFLVVLNGALVTKTESGLGCGNEWPLCNGKFVPAYTIESMVEYSHRAVTGIVGLMVLAVFVLVWRHMKKKRDAFLYASSILLFTVVQAIMGALAVVYTQSPPVMALHFGFSLLAFASSFLLAAAMRRYAKEQADSPRVYPRAVTDTYRYSIWLTLLYTYIVVYVGAFVRHTDSSGGCMGWPLCNGQVIPELSGGTLIVFMHRLAALLLFILVAWIAHVAYHSYKDIPEIRSCGVWTLVLCVGQVLSGALVVFTISNENWLLFTSLLHTVFICGQFSVLCHMSIRAWQLREDPNRVAGHSDKRETAV